MGKDNYEEEEKEKRYRMRRRRRGELKRRRRWGSGRRRALPRPCVMTQIGEKAGENAGDQRGLRDTQITLSGGGGPGWPEASAQPHLNPRKGILT